MNDEKLELFLSLMQELVEANQSRNDELRNLSTKIDKLEGTLWSGLIYDDGLDYRPQVLDVATALRNLNKNAGTISQELADFNLQYNELNGGLCK